VNSAESAYTIFNNALELPDPAERTAYLDDACARDAALRERVEKLLKADSEAGGFFSQPLNPAESIQSASAMAAHPMEKPGEQIERYNCSSKSAKADAVWFTWPSSRSRCGVEWR
jgi:hypothetical protein